MLTYLRHRLLLSNTRLDTRRLARWGTLLLYWLLLLGRGTVTGGLLDYRLLLLLALARLLQALLGHGLTRTLGGLLLLNWSCTTARRRRLTTETKLKQYIEYDHKRG